MGEHNAGETAGHARLLQLATEENRDLAMFVLLATATGARRSELIAPGWSDIDFDGKNVTICRRLGGLN